MKQRAKVEGRACALPHTPLYSSAVQNRNGSAVDEPDRLGREPTLLCLPCLMQGAVRRAWTVSEGRACCIRHAVEDSRLDDMDQHDLFVRVYEALRLHGYPDAY